MIFIFKRIPGIPGIPTQQQNERVSNKEGQCKNKQT